MADSNAIFQDALIAHAIDVERFGAGLVRRLTRILDQSDEAAIADLAARLAKLGPNVFASKSKMRQLRRILAELDEQRRGTYLQLHQDLRDELRALMPFEAAWAVTTFGAAVRIVEARMEMPASKVLRSLPTSRPLQGMFLKEWSDKLRRDDFAVMMRAVRAGIAQGQTVEQIVTGLQLTSSTRRRNLATLVRTAVSAASNLAREAVFRENEQYVDFMRWTSVLDSKTTLICANRHGHIVPIRPGAPIPAGFILLSPPDARPPAHPNCRSVMEAILSALGIVGDRASVTLDDGERVVFRDLAREDAGRRWSGMSRSERAAATAAAREDWALQHVGGPAPLPTFESFFSRQSAAWQNEYLGPTRAKAFRANALALQDFVDASGREYTLAELIEQHPAARALLSR